MDYVDYATTNAHTSYLCTSFVSKFVDVVTVLESFDTPNNNMALSHSIGEYDSLFCIETVNSRSVPYSILGKHTYEYYEYYEYYEQYS